jgi:hypothetical protein
LAILNENKTGGKKKKNRERVCERFHERLKNKCRREQGFIFHGQCIEFRHFNATIITYNSFNHNIDLQMSFKGFARLT